jgi:hypothetical protein
MDRMHPMAAWPNFVARDPCDGLKVSVGPRRVPLAIDAGAGPE